MATSPSIPFRLSAENPLFGHELSKDIPQTPELLDIMKNHRDNIEFKSIPKSQPLYQDGDDAEYAYIIQSGLVKLSFTGEDSKRSISPFFFSRNDIVGIAEMFSFRPYQGTASAMNECSVIALHKDFIHDISKDSNVMNHLLGQISRQNTAAEKTFKTMAHHSATKQIIKTLLDWPESYTRQTPEGSILSGGAIHNIVEKTGKTYETVCKALSSFRQQGLIHKKGPEDAVHGLSGALLIPDRDALENYMYEYEKKFIENRSANSRNAKNTQDHEGQEPA